MVSALEENFVGVINRNHARDAHAHPIPARSRSCLIVPPVSILHTSLSNAERVGSLGNNRKFQRTYERRRYAFLARDTLCRPASTSSLKRTGIPCREIAVQLRHVAGVQKSRNFDFITRDSARALMQKPITAVWLFFLINSNFNFFILLYLCTYSGFIESVVL